MRGHHSICSQTSYSQSEAVCPSDNMQRRNSKERETKAEQSCRCAVCKNLNCKHGSEKETERPWIDPRFFPCTFRFSMCVCVGCGFSSVHVSTALGTDISGWIFWKDFELMFSSSCSDSARRNRVVVKNQKTSNPIRVKTTRASSKEWKSTSISIRNRNADDSVPIAIGSYDLRRFFVLIERIAVSR